jgi:conjugal transfer ATP-binding protein TraC
VINIVKQISQKLAAFLHEEKEATLNVNHRKLKDLIEIDYPNFANILPYRYFWKEKGIFVNENSLGFGLEISVLSGADEKTINSIADLLRYKIPDGYDLQFILWGSNQVGDIIDSALQTKGNDIYASLAKTSSHYYKKGARDGFKNKQNLPLTLREYRLFCFLSKNTAYSEDAVADLLASRTDLIAEFESNSLDYAPINLELFLSLLHVWINPDVNDIYPRQIKHYEYSTLNEQVVDKSFELMHEPDRITIECHNKERVCTKITNLSLRNLPDKFALWMSADNFFNIFRASQAIRCPFLISMHARLVPQAEAKTKVKSRYLGILRKANSVYAKHFSGTKKAAEEWEKIHKEIDSDEVRLTKAFFNIVLFSKEGEEKRDESAAISCYRYNGIELFNTKYMQLQSFLAVLPFLLSEGLFSDLKKAGRLKTMTTWNLANLLPLVADDKLGRKGVLLTSFRNQVSFFDMYSEHLPIVNFNLAVAATSGAGKSFFVQAILNYVLSISGRCFVIDLGHSYHKFCEIVGGTYLEYGSLKLNPFSNIHDIKESSEQIRDLLAVLASPDGDLIDVQEEYLRQAVIIAWEKKGNEANVDEVITALKELNSKRKDNRISDLITLLDRYGKNGAYHDIFNTYSAIAPDASFVVLELGDLQNKPTLLKAVLFALMLHIEEEMYHSPRNQPKMVVIDEAWRLLAGDNKAAARFIEKGYRTARRHNGSFVTITQSIEDFLKNEEAKACWNCSDIKVIMLQNSKAFDDFMLSHEGYFDPYVESLIRHFKEAKANGFSEFMLQIGKTQSFHRLFVDPFSRVMFSSSGKEFEAVKAKRDQGLSISESILEVAKENYADEFC